jgi:glycosyltransferase involved in cell wall biosynthesis
MKSENRKLIVIPGSWRSLGGTLVTLSALLKGFEELGLSNNVCVLVRPGSTNEGYLKQAGQEYCLQYVSADSHSEFLEKALVWAQNQQVDNPLLLDNWVSKVHLPVLVRAAPKLRLSGRYVYHFFHDLAHSKKILGYLARRITFTILSPQGICNSNFTAKHIQKFGLSKCKIMYQPVDLEKFSEIRDKKSSLPLPESFRKIVESGAKIILTPSRISKPHEVNDKNLRALIPVLSDLKACGHNFHLVIIGQDISSGRVLSKHLLDLAYQANVDERFTILPPTYEIEQYYKCSDVVLTLAPREPFGRVVVEAIACGVPVIGSNTGGINEILQNFAPQWVVNPDNPRQVAESIIDVLNSPKTPKLLHQGKNWIADKCSPKGYAQQMALSTQLISDL